MSGLPSRKALDEAAGWFFRQDGRLLSAEERARFESWIAVAENRAAYAEIGGAWDEAAGLPAPLPATAEVRSRTPQRVGLAAALAMALVCVGYVFDVPARLQADVYTETGEFRSVTLPDGTRVQVNTASALSIAFTPEERRVSLIKGEAVFTVAADPSRPFRVETDGDTVTALGTVFAVRETGGGAIVTVLESRVSLAFADGGPAVEIGQGEQARPLGNGHELAKVDAEVATAWRRGKLIFADRPLGSVIEELNRYHPGRIQIVDPELRSRRVSGVFETRDPLAVVAALEDTMGVSSTRVGSFLVLLHR